MTVLIGIGAARAPCPTRGIIDIAAVRTVAAVGATMKRLPIDTSPLLIFPAYDVGDGLSR